MGEKASKMVLQEGVGKRRGIMSEGRRRWREREVSEGGGGTCMN